jgi:hypothetical protein
VDANEDRHSRHEPERQPSFEFGFSGSDEPFSSPLLHYGVWDNFSPQKNNTQKNTRQSMNMKTKILHVSGCRSGSDCVFYQEGDLVQAKVDLSKIPNWLL